MRGARQADSGVAVVDCPPALESGEVQILIVDLDRAPDPDELIRHVATLGREERRRLASMTHPEVRREFLCGRLALRHLLGIHQGIAPEDVQLQVSDAGKPELAPGQGQLWFNLSHTRGLLVLAACRAAEVGVDVEDATRRAGGEAVAERFFAETEVEALRRLPPTERARQFYRLWTLKEAYVKARGLTLPATLRHLSFRLDGETVEPQFAPELGEQAQGWQFEQRWWAERFVIGAAVARGAEQQLAFRWQEWRPPW